MFKALFIMPNEKTSDVGALLAVARDAARKREGAETNPSIRALEFIAELGIFVAVYEAVERTNSNQEKEKLKVS
jgi:hypothetical protein